MGYSMFFAGELAVAELDAFLAAAVDPKRRRDWIGVLAWNAGTRERRSVRDTLAKLPGELITKAGSWLDATIDEASGRITVRGVLVEDDFNVRGVELADLFRVASAHGGRGQLFFLEEQAVFHPQEEELCYAVRVTPEDSMVEHVSEQEQLELAQGALFAPVIARIRAEIEGVLAAMKPATAKPKAKAKPKPKAKAKPKPKAKAKPKPKAKAKPKR